MEKGCSLFCSFMKTGNFRAGQGSCPHMERVIIWCIKMGFFWNGKQIPPQNSSPGSNSADLCFIMAQITLQPKHHKWPRIGQ